MRKPRKSRKPEKRYIIIYGYTGNQGNYVGTKDEVLAQLKIDIDMGELERPDDVHVHELGAEVPITFERVMSVVWADSPRTED